jgi:BTB/POZ domain
MSNADDRNIKWITFRQHLASLQRDIFENVSYTDCVLKAEGRVIHVHRAVLSHASDYLAFLIKTAPVFETPTLIIADYDYALVRDIVVFIYTGEVYVEQARYEMFKDACIDLGLKSFDRKDRSTQAISKRRKRTENPLKTVEDVQIDEVVLPNFGEATSSDDEDCRPIKKSEQIKFQGIRC